MKSNTRQITEDISEALFDVISIEKVGKKIKKLIKKSSKKIAKKVAKLKKRQEKAAEKAKNKILKVVVPRIVKDKTLPMKKTVSKKAIVTPKISPVKQSQKPT